MKLYMFRRIRLSIIRSLFTVHSAMVYVIQVCRQLASRTRMEHVHVTCPANFILFDLFTPKYLLWSTNFELLCHANLPRLLLLPQMSSEYFHEQAVLNLLQSTYFL